MSTIRRITSGSLAGWMRMATILFGQILTVPFFLSKWTPSEYGAFLLAQSFVSILNTLDVGHQNYLGYRFIASRSPSAISLETFSAIPFSLLLGAGQLLIALMAAKLDLFHLSGTTVGGRPLAGATTNAIFLLLCTWIVSGGVGGVFGRTIAPFGHFPRLAWWNVLNAALQISAPVAACLAGSDLYGATLALCGATLIYNAALYIDIAGLWRKEGLHPTLPNLQVGARNAWNALALVIREFFLQFRQQGVRTLLAPVAGTEALASFTITRTGANVALQGLATLTSPLEPEILRFSHEREDRKLNLSLTLLSLFIVALINTPTIALQYIAPHLFTLWTHGKILFDPILFALLSSTVTFFAISQPALIIVRGNNLLKEQLHVTVISSLIALGGIFLLTSRVGLRGAAASLLAAEAYAALHTIVVARTWARKNGLTYPDKALGATIASVIVTLAASLLIALTSTQLGAWLAIAGLLSQATFVAIIFGCIPNEMRARVTTPLKRRNLA